VYSLLGHSSGFGKSVCLIELSGSYSKHTPAVGFHFACSLPKPFFAYALSFSSCPLRSLIIRISENNYMKQHSALLEIEEENGKTT
jgi:hypothetical protein